MTSSNWFCCAKVKQNRRLIDFDTDAEMRIMHDAKAINDRQAAISAGCLSKMHQEG